MRSTILIVDDNDLLRDLLTLMLEKGGYTVITAGSCEECCTLLETATPDLILLDVMMEPHDGWETLRRIRAHSLTADIPVLMLTAKQVTPADALAYADDIDGYIMKPVTRFTLLKSLEYRIKREESLKREMEDLRQSGKDTDLVSEYGSLEKRVESYRQICEYMGDLFLPENRDDRFPEPVVDDFLEKTKAQEARLKQVRKELGMA